MGKFFGFRFPAVFLLVVLGASVFGCANQVNHPPANPVLNEARIEYGPGGRTEYGPAWTESRHGIRLVYLEGDSAKRARQEGNLLRQEIRRGAAPLMESYMRAVWNSQEPADAGLWGGLTPPQCRDFVYRGMNPVDAAYLQVLAEAAGVDLETLTSSLFFPDICLYLGSYLKAFPNLAEVAAGARQPRTGSAFAAWGEYTTDQRMIIGINSCFPATNRFASSQTATCHRTPDGNWYVLFGAAGMSSFADAGINSRGLAVVMQFVQTKEPTLGNAPSLGLAGLLLRSAGDIEEALEIASRTRVNVGTKFILAHYPSNTAAIVEMSARESFAVRESGREAMASVQGFASDKLQDSGLFFNPSQRQDLEMRLGRMEEMIDLYKGRLDPEAAHLILQDRFSPVIGDKRAMGEIIAAPATVKSLVIDIREGVFYLPSGPAPVCDGPYYGFSIPRIFLGAPGEKESAPLSPGEFYKTPVGDSARRIFDAYEVFWWERNPAEALRLVQQAGETFSDEPLYHLLGGLLALRENDFPNANLLFKKALTFPQTHHRRATTHLWMGRNYDLMGQRDKAILEYGIVSRYPGLDPELGNAALGNLAKRFEFRPSRPMAIDFLNPDTLLY